MTLLRKLSSFIPNVQEHSLELSRTLLLSHSNNYVISWNSKQLCNVAKNSVMFSISKPLAVYLSSFEKEF